jgi:hypothetical protein
MDRIALCSTYFASIIHFRTVVHSTVALTNVARCRTLQCLWSEMTIPNAEIVQMLLRAGADPNAMTSDGYTPFAVFSTSRRMLKGPKSTVGDHILALLPSDVSSKAPYTEEPAVPFDTVLYC